MPAIHPIAVLFLFLPFASPLIVLTTSKKPLLRPTSPPISRKQPPLPPLSRSVRRSLIILAAAADGADDPPLPDETLDVTDGVGPNFRDLNEPVEDYAARFTADDYLKSLSRFADDGRSLLQAPQRYSSRQWRTNLFSIVRCRTLRAVRNQLLWQIVWALLVSLIYMFSEAWMRVIIPTMPALPHSLLGGVMGVLLGFRTNQSYDRFWEGRKLWGQCFNACRNVARSSLVYLDADKETYDTVIRHVKAYPVALKQHLRGEFEMNEFAGTLETREINMLSTVDNLPLSICTSLSMAINPIKLDTQQSANNLLWWVLEDHVSKLSGIIADCERLVRTPVPLAYAVHTSRLLSLWVGTLPFVLVGCFSGARRLLTVPLTAFVAWALFCTEELGHIIEEPFGAFNEEGEGSEGSNNGERIRTEILPLDRYCESLQNDLSAANRFTKSASKALEEGQAQRVAEEGGITNPNQADQQYGPGVGGRSGSETVSEEEAIEIAWDAKQTVEAVEAEQAMEQEERDRMAYEALKASRDPSWSTASYLSGTTARRRPITTVNPLNTPPPSVEDQQKEPSVLEAGAEALEALDNPETIENVVVGAAEEEEEPEEEGPLSGTEEEFNRLVEKGEEAGLVSAFDQEVAAAAAEMGVDVEESQTTEEKIEEVFQDRQGNAWVPTRGANGKGGAGGEEEEEEGGDSEEQTGRVMPIFPVYDSSKTDT